MYFSKVVLSVLSLGLLGWDVHAAKVTFCVRPNVEDEGYGPFEKEKIPNKTVQEMEDEWLSQGKQVALPDEQAHIHGITGHLNARCQLTKDGARVKFALCHRGNTDDPFTKDVQFVEILSPDYKKTYTDAGSEVNFPGDKVTIGGKTKWLNNNCVGKNSQTVPSVYGDPHFKTWGDGTYDFHGGCDLVMMNSPVFQNGLGLRVHIRTKVSSWWSFIEAAVLQLGDDTLEIKGGESSVQYWINGKEGHELQDGETSLGDFPVVFKRTNDHQGRARVELGNGNAIGLETFKGFVRVNVNPGTPEKFEGTVGLLGSFPEGDKLARNGSTIFENDEFGQEWQVLASEPMLFHSVEGVQHPSKCVMPDQTLKSKQSRRLGEAVISEEEATLACARVEESDRDQCIFDVLATNDKDMAGSY